jgi:predicted transcriptional regulator
VKQLSQEKEKRKEEKEDIEALKEVLTVVSKEIPNLIKSIIGSVFSEDAGRDMGKAAAAFYKELKEAGMPEETAVKMTENYISVFTNLGELLKRVGKEGKIVVTTEKGKEIGEEISRKIKEKLSEKHEEEEEDEE